MSFTAFEVNGRLFEFTRLPFGVTNAVAAFQREMTAFVRRHNLKRTHPYLDDVIIGGRSEEEHQENLKNFLKAAEIEGLTLNKAKCVFGCKTVPMLGHIVGAGSKRPDPSRIKTLMDFPIPENSSQLKRLLGFFAYNAKWIADYSNKVAPLLATQKQLAFPLNQASRLAIATLKKEVASAVLWLPRANEPLVLQTDASGTGIGATLTQNDKPVGFFSRTLKHSEMAYSVVEREAMAILEGFRRFSDLLRTSRVLVRTDQKALSFIFGPNSSRVKNDKLIRWRLELSEYNFEISYQRGCQNVSADALSRLASLQPSCKTLHETLAHPGVTRLYEYIQRHKVPISLDDAKRVTENCKTCALWKPRFLRPSGSDLIRSSKPWERLSIDIVGPKPMTRNKNQYLLTVVDEFSRFPFAFPLRNITSSSVIKCLSTLFAIFGTPGFIHSDRVTQFVSLEFQNFCRQNGVATSKTTPYHPQGNGQNERYNGIVWKAVQCLLHSTNRPLTDWESVLPSALSSIRTLIDTVTKESPHDRFFCFKRGEPLIRAGLHEMGRMK